MFTQNIHPRVSSNIEDLPLPTLPKHYRTTELTDYMHPGIYLGNVDYLTFIQVLDTAHRCILVIAWSQFSPIEDTYSLAYTFTNYFHLLTGL